jgi:hypothetical protein
MRQTALIARRPKCWAALDAARGERAAVSAHVKDEGEGEGEGTALCFGFIAGQAFSFRQRSQRFTTFGQRASVRDWNIETSDV